MQRDLAPFFPILLWGIAGIEATQATQFFKINNQGSGVGANNSVPMIARKELILRIYPRTGSLATPSPSTVTGTVTHPGKPTLAPINGPVPVGALSSIQRTNANQSLNFRIPAADCIGTVSFTVKITDTANPANTRTQVVTLTFQEVPPVRVHGVLIHYTGKGMNIPAPSGIDLINTLKYIAQTYPISGITYTSCEVIEFNGDLTVGGGGGCGTGWNQLFNRRWNMRSASGTTDVFIGLLPGGDRCLFEVIATAGIRSATSRTTPVKIARKPRKAYILEPADKTQTIHQGEELHLVRGGFSPEAGTIAFDEVTWISDKDRPLGTGYQVVTNALSKGVHTIGIQFPDGLGKQASDSVRSP